MVRKFTTAVKMPRDPNTLSNYDEIRTTHITTNFELDFVNKRLSGSVLLSLKALKDVKKVILDSRYGFNVTQQYFLLSH